MHVAADETMGKRPHGIHQDIPGNRLDDVFHKLGAVTFNPLPFLICSHAFIGDRFTAKTVLANPGLDVGKPPAGREGDEEHPALVNEPDSMACNLRAGRTFWVSAVRGGLLRTVHKTSTTYTDPAFKPFVTV